MPSRAQLEEFKTSFKDVGSEALIMKDSMFPMEEVELPENDPPSPFPEGLDEIPFTPAEALLEPGSDIDDDIEPALPPGSLSDAPDPGFDFSDILGNGLDSLGLGLDQGDSESSLYEEPTEPPPAPSPETELPEDLLSGFSDDLETGGLPIDEEMSETIEKIPEPEDFSASAGLDLGDLGGDFPMDMGETSPEVPADSAAPGVENETPPDFSDIEFPDIDLSQAVDMGGESREEPLPKTGQDNDDFNLENIGDFGSNSSFKSGFETIDLETDAGPEDETANAPANDLTGDFDAGDFGSDLSIPDFGGDLDAGGMEQESALPAEETAESFGSEDLGADFDTGDFGLDMSTPGMDGGFAAEPAEEIQDTTPGLEGDDFGELPETGEETGTPDAFDAFTAGDDWKVPDTPLETPDFSAPPPAAEDFGDFSLPGFDDAGKPGAEPSLEFGVTEEVEEIRLSEDDYRRLQDTLSAYPLNLRIACEELIAEQAVDPAQMSALIKLLTRGAPAKETAALAGKILGRAIPIPKGYAKQTGEELEEEQASLGYIFVKRFLPVLRIAGAIAVVAVSLGYLIWRFAVLPMQAERRYKEGYALIQSAEYVLANERFRQGFEIHRVKNWFYRYAEAFRDERQYIYAERKYDDLLRFYPRDKKGALDYAAMETYYIKNYQKADRIIREHILDYSINDREGLLALAENNLAWGEFEYSRYDEARAAYARLMEKYGRQDPYLEGMLKYFIRTDNLGEVLPLRSYFMSNPKKRKITVPTLAELGGYLLDKQLEEPDGVPNEYADKIEGIRDVLIRAIETDRTYPESYYHLARYYNHYESVSEERQTLRDAIRVFAAAPEETPRRAAYRIDTHRRYAEVLIKAREFFPAEEELIRGVRLYEDARARQVIKTSSPEFGRLYANLGDLEFYVKSGNMDAALRFYEEAERNGWAPPEIQYRMGAAHYQNEQWEEALRRFFALTSIMPNNKRLLYALGNTSYLRGNYFAAQGYYNRLMDLLDMERIRNPNLVPGLQTDDQDLVERIMVSDNNLGVTLEALTRITGDTSYRSRALYLFSESIRAWDILTRDPQSMARMRPFRELYGPGINLAYLNTQNILHPSPSYDQQIFMRIDRDSLESSPWELLVPRDYRLSDQLLPTGAE
ncbi:MAG: tetratricopeptide repeat protein [Treponema sp.]|nr:tetratricopeptide repeat protein [Treponema sp.]